MTWFGLAYTCALHLYAAAMLPRLAIQAIFKKKGRTNFWARLGRDFPTIIRRDQPVIWIHAVSLGETKLVSPLVDSLKSSAQIILSTTTETGHAEGMRCAVADYHVYLPFDLPYIIKPILKRVKPDVIIIVETDFWFHFQHIAKQLGARLYLINGKLSKTSFGRYKKLPFLAKRLLHEFDHLYVQTSEYKQRFLNLGIDQNKLTVTGNIKIETMGLKPRQLHPDYFVITIGSTHAPEEKMWIDALKQLPIKGYLVPRHPERFKVVEQLLIKNNICYGKWSQGATFDAYQVILVDQMGCLGECYSRAHVAFVGGSFTAKVGGHNLLEPLQYGVPVLFGPYTWGQPDFTELVLRNHAGILCQARELKQLLMQFLRHDLPLEEMGERGKRIFSEYKGSLERIALGVKEGLC